jgi:hypothetical protein
MWVLVDRVSGRILAIGHGETKESNHDLSVGSLVYLPEQDVSGLYEERCAGAMMLRECYYPGKLILFSVEEATVRAGERVDAETDAAIQSALHPVAARGEEAAIHREQLQAILDKLGMKPTEKFAHLAEIADKAVAAGQETKATVAKAG